MEANTEMRGDKRRVVVAMSGGVDSSVAAALLADAGFDVVGVTMRLFSAPSDEAARLNRSCCSVEDVEDARSVCREIGTRHYFMNFEREFKQHVIDYFVGEYSKGRTPYPCLACNDRLKFDFLMKRADLLDADFVATGHYAQLATEGGRVRLRKAVDPMKDQSYVLYTLRQDQMHRLLLPVGGHSKDAIRDIARERALAVADKPDSQDICFIPDGDYRSFVAPRLDQVQPGVIRGPDGDVLREHEGVHNFTIGQRKGLGLPGGSGRPLFVSEIDPGTGTVRLGPVESLMRQEVFASAVNWTSGETPSRPVSAKARIRYKSGDEHARITPMEGGARIEFDRPQRAPTPGQAIVFYDGDEVLGGGIIELSGSALRRDARMTARV